MRWLKLISFLLYGALLSCGAHHVFVAARVDPEDVSRVLVVREKQDNPSELRRFEGSVFEVTPSPSGVLVGVLERITLSESPRQFNFRLHVLNDNGQTLRIVDNVHRFSFSLDEQYIAVIRGKAYEGAPGFRPTSTEILGLSTADLGPIEGLEKATEIQWTRFKDEGDVLLAKVIDEDIVVMQFVIDTLTLVPTDYLSTHFSPDGRFYYLTPAEALRADLCEPGVPHDSCVRVYARESTQPLNLPIDAHHRRLLGWVDGQGIIVANERNHQSQVLDVASSRTRIRVKAVDWWWHTRPGFVIRRRSTDNPNFNEVGKLRVDPIGPQSTPEPDTPAPQR